MLVSRELTNLFILNMDLREEFLYNAEKAKC